MSMTSKKSWWFLQSVLLLLSLSQKNCLSTASDTILQGQTLSGNQTITSQGGIFELGFFKPGNSQNYYIGIWYKTLPNQTVVWVANRNQPVSDPSSSTLKLTQNGTLVLLNQSKSEIWSTNSSNRGDNPNPTIVVLLDSGNLVIREFTNKSNAMIWQSFDHPTDTWLPGSKLGHNKLTNLKQNFVPWKNSENPAPGIFSFELEKNGTSHLLVWSDPEAHRHNPEVYVTTGVWDGKLHRLVPELQRNNYVKNMTYITNENESYFTYEAAVPSAFTRFFIDVTGQLKQFVWRKDAGGWVLFWMRPELQCQVYGFCGGFSICNQIKLSLCDCIPGFRPKTPSNWELGDHSDGCVRKSGLHANGNDTFVMIPNIMFPLNQIRFYSPHSFKSCKLACLSDSMCTAYGYDKTSCCIVWRDDLLNLQQLSPEDKAGDNLYVRVAESELVGVGVKNKPKGKTIWIVIGSIGGFVTLLGIVLLIIFRRRRLASGFQAVDDSLLLFKYQDLRSATKNFSEKLGKGGFGCVYKGSLPCSISIAVKELNCLPKQGEKQFRAEVSTIGTIQHINLVRLRGFCAEASKRFLVYEYMPNGSLETHLFRNTTNTLDWKTRYNVAIGTARGLSYLHEKCRDCIIHCDIKPENILLDPDYNPKVADFGLAKLIGREFSRVLTSIRGTRGYIAPEWISGEPITPKADVFSYGMLLFEIISGRRNRDVLDDQKDNYFPSRVVNAINKNEDVLALLDDRLEGSADINNELLRACKVACWCIQDDEKDRPTMGNVVQILEGVCEVGTPPIPRFIQHLAERIAGTMVYQETTENSDIRTRTF